MAGIGGGVVSIGGTTCGAVYDESGAYGGAGVGAYRGADVDA
jgi:hypothetical protein